MRKKRKNLPLLNSAHSRLELFVLLRLECLKRVANAGKQ